MGKQRDKGKVARMTNVLQIRTSMCVTENWRKVSRWMKRRNGLQEAPGTSPYSYLTIEARWHCVPAVEDQQRLSVVLVMTPTGHVQLLPLSARYALGQQQRNPAGPFQSSRPESEHHPAAGSGDGSGG